MNMNQRGWKPISIKPDTDERLNKIALIKDETYNSIITRLLDHWDATHGNTK